MTLSRRARSGLTAIAVAAVVGALTGAATRPGLGYGYDGIVYMASAERLRSAGDLRVPFSMRLRGDPDAARALRDSTTPLVHWPPGYPLTLAAASTVTGDLANAAWFTNALSIAATTGLLTLLLSCAFTPVAGAIGGLVYLLTPAVIQVQFEVLSEPLFVGLVASAVAGMVLAPARTWVYGGIAGLAFLTRYLGIAMGGAAVVFAALVPGAPRTRLLRATVAATPTALAVMALSFVQGDAPGARAYAYYAGVSEPLRRAATAVAYLLVSPLVVKSRGLAITSGVLLVAAIVFLAIAAIRRGSEPTGREATVIRERLLTASATGIASIVLVLLASRMFADPQLDFDGRVLLPVVLLAELAVLTLAFSWFEERGGRTRRASIAGGVLLLALLVVEDALLARRLREAPRGYPTLAGDHYRAATGMAAFRDDRRPVFSDAPQLAWWYGRRSARLLPDLGDPGDVRKLRGQTTAGAVVVTFSRDVPDEVTRRLACAEGARCTWLGNTGRVVP